MLGLQRAPPDYLTQGYTLRTYLRSDLQQPNFGVNFTTKDTLPIVRRPLPPNHSFRPVHSPLVSLNQVTNQKIAIAQPPMAPYYKTAQEMPYRELSPSALMNIKGDAASATAAVNHEYTLELNTVSYIRSFTTGRWYWKLFNPPITAQFLKDVTCSLHGGEIMGVTGCTGSGKTTLLNVVAHRVQGSIGGSILLNHRPLNTATFRRLCAYVSFRQVCNPHLTVRQTLEYHAALALSSSLSQKEKRDRVNQLLREFELMDYSRRKVDNLPESSRRRLLIAYHLVKDPVLLLVDEPTRGVDALSSYQLMYALSQYMKKRNRMCIVTMMTPRSDIYPLLDRTTLLFFGEVAYSGYTKMMPQYFRNIGFSCPATENPAIYFLSLASLDRETSVRYLETQDQAVKLIEVFKSEGQGYAKYTPNSLDAFTSNPYLPLCQYGKANAFLVTLTLTKRTFQSFAGNKLSIAYRLFLLPLFAVLLFLFYNRLKNSATYPQSMAGLIFNCMTAVSMISCGLTTSTSEVHRNRFYQETEDSLYGGTVFFISQLLSTFAFDVCSVFGFSAIVYWNCISEPDLIGFLMFSAVLWCCFQFAALFTAILMLFIRSSFRVATVGVTLLAIQLVAASGVLRSSRGISRDVGDWFHYLTFGSIYRFSAVSLQFQELNNFNISDCVDPRTRNRAAADPSGFPCRWETGMDYLTEVYSESDLRDPWLNFGICFAFVGALTCITLIIYSLPIPYCIRRKFLYK